MKCVFCTNTIDETKTLSSEADQRLHSAALEQWTQVEVKQGSRTVLREHACPSHANVTAVTLALPSSAPAVPAPLAAPSDVTVRR